MKNDTSKVSFVPQLIIPSCRRHCHLPRQRLWWWLSPGRGKNPFGPRWWIRNGANS